MKAIVLGGTAPHITLIRELKERGYETILVDYLPDPPAKAFADRHIQESTLDRDMVLKIAREEKADLVVSACIDQTNSVCCYVAEQLGLPHPYSYDTSVAVTVKSVMKKIFAENGVPSTWYFAGKSIAEIPWDKVAYPAVVKPVDCNSSKGVRRVNDEAEAKLHFEEALALSRTKEALIEGFASGAEIAVDCFAHDGTADFIMVREKKQISRELDQEMNVEGSIVPAPSCVGLEDSLREVGEKIARGFGLENTPFFYQAIVGRDGSINVIEFAPRVGGGLSYYMLKEFAHFDAVRLVVNSYLGIHEPLQNKPLDRFYSTNLLYMEPGVFDHIEGFEEAKAKGLIKESFVLKTKGTEITSEMRSGNRVGAFVVEAESPEGLLKKEKEAYTLVKVINSDGKSCLKGWK